MEKIKDFEETRNCYFCRHCEAVESRKGGETSYKFYCEAHKCELKKIGYCGKFERAKNER